ncbi:C-X-C motif chemokine 9-like [Synchiropus splendidus]|uniref:C-X-C motif chemokine 9-like n=1 Tax=Synchiropus splendidus TaxID=270530 RepID=UPI00237DC0AF|nr:C-X-C motif chemokine 9-like [Synchiropus splendidus]
MSHCVKVMLLLVAMVSICAAHFHQSTNSCLCTDIRPRITQHTKVSEIQAYAATNFCNNVEIVVTEKRGNRYCLDPNAEQVQKMIQNMRRK